MRMERFAMCCIALIVCLVEVNAQTRQSVGLTSYYKARDVLDSGIKAIGGLKALRSTVTVQRKLVGEWIGSGQGKRPSLDLSSTLAAPLANGRSRRDTVIDYQANRWFSESVESDDTGDQITRLVSVKVGEGFETIAYRKEKRLLRTFSPEEALSIRVSRFRQHPEGLLLMALGRSETLQWVGKAREFGRSQRVISFADQLGMRVLLYFDDKTNLLTKSETLRSHSLSGDSFSEVIYSDYRPVGELRLPFHYLDRMAGIPTEELRASSIEVNVDFPVDYLLKINLKDTFQIADQPSNLTVQPLGKNLYLIRGSYNVVFAVFRDYVVVLEAPVSSAYSEECLRLIHNAVPDKPIRYVVATHFHYDHIAGLRPYIARGVQIITTPDAKPVIEQLATSRRTMHPDLLTQRVLAPKIEVVSRQRVFNDAMNRLELHEFGPTQHVAEMLVGYFPRQKLLFQADLWDPLSDNLPFAGADTARLDEKTKGLGLQVERIIPVHGIPATSDMLHRGLGLRAKYIH